MKAVLRILRLGRSGRGRLALAVLLGVLAAGSAAALAGTSAWLIARAAEHPPVLHLMVAIVAVRAFGLGRGVLRYFERLVAHDASFRVLGDVRVKVVERAERLLPGDRASFSEGDLLARFVSDVDGLTDLWVRVVLPGAVTVAVLAGATGVFVALLPAAGLVAAASLGVAFVAAPAAAHRLSRRAAAHVAPDRAMYQQQLLTVLEGAAELAVYDALDTELEKLAAGDRRLRGAERRAAWSTGVGTAVALVAAGAGVIGGLWVAASALADDRIDGATLAVVVLLPLAAHELVAALTPVAAALPQLISSAQRVVEVLDAPDVVAEPAHPLPLPTAPYGLRLRGVGLAWPGGPLLVKGLDLDVAPGATIAITGASGVGKSTLAATLLRFVEPAAGTLELVGADGSVDLCRVQPDELRRVIGWCAQDAHVFDSTLAANLLLARPDATDAQLLEALQAVRLDEWVDSLPDGLQTMVGEHGAAMSGGERQRLSLARVVLSGAGIVLIDEPTEHLDDTTAASVLDDLLAATRGRTVLVVTHRVDLVASRVDAVVALDAAVA